ncbi:MULTISPECIES: phage minor head protein [Streptomyces]|uniref:Phage minor head protein n=1 Tax=Streptomyces flavovirens TaxID=52258 RepID=A0ABV8NCE1_9ACTN|nr:phage minor head protein [Streptomyces sp. MBT51]
MTPTELEAALTRAEEDLDGALAEVLADVAEEFSDALDDATEIVAAWFSVSRIAAIWGARVPRLLRRFLGITETAAAATAEDVGLRLPDGWDDLPARYDDDTLPPELGDYVTRTDRLLRSVGQSLSKAATAELADGLDAGEDIDQLRRRLRDAFSDAGAQLGDSRAERIAQTEATRAWNSATLAAARALTGPERPLVKQWISRGDSRVRDAHRKANGQLQFLDDPFTVGGTQMAGPGDPTAPASQTVNCRCVLRVQTADREESTMPGPGSVTAAADGSHRTGAMIALVPTKEDAARLALEDGELADELHLTLYFLGAGADWTEDQRQELIANVRNRAADITRITARAFGAAHWNAGTDTPSWVWSVGDDRDANPDDSTLSVAQWEATYALEDRHGPEIPVQHSPWVPHVCAAYSDDPSLLPELEARLGPITFDRIRLAFAGEITDIPLGPTPVPAEEPTVEQTAADTVALAPRTWTTPGDTAIAYENQETGDGRIFAPGSLYWEDGPWPLQYADEMLSGHEGAELAGAIQTITRDGDRIASTGVLYPGRPAGADAVLLLDQNAPLGVSVDLDDVDIEFIDRTPASEGEEPEEAMLSASLATASVLRLDDGAWMVRATTAAEWTASGRGLLRAGHTIEWTTAPDGTLPATGLRTALTAAGITAAAGDSDDPDRGALVHSQSAGDVLMRITRGRVRGATLVSMPAYAQARIVLDPLPTPEQSAALYPPPTITASSDTLQRVIVYVSSSPFAVGARHVAEALGITMVQARRHLSRGVKAGHLVRLSRGLYVGAPTDLSASVTGDVSLPVHPDPDRPWDGDTAASNVLAWATGEDGVVDPARLAAAFLYRDTDANPATLSAYKLGFADVVDDQLQIIATAVYAIGSVLQGGMGGVELPDADRDDIRDRVEDLYDRLADAYDDPTLTAPWDDDMTDNELEASAWTAMREAPPMPAAWFREPTLDELPPGSGGVHYRDGRIYGWVAQAGEPHAGMPGRNLTIESLGDIDTTHFLRARFNLDDSTTVKAGAMTMNVGHHRDGAECETASCQFDDTRTVAGIVTVGMNSRGMWFSGAAAPWLSTWDALAFQACQPSYHMRQGRRGQWQLRAVLSVPVPGHSSPLTAATIERSNLALAASAAMAVPIPGAPADTAPEPADTSTLAGLTAALTQPAFIDTLLDAMDRRTTERAAAQAEIDRLTQQLAPARQEIAAALVATVKGGN